MGEDREAAITLVRHEDTDGTRTVRVRCRADGAVLVEGQDLGPGVEAFFGPGNDEYEWTVVVGPDRVPALAAALGVAPEDVLDGLTARFSGREAFRLDRLLSEQGFETDRFTHLSR